MSSHHGNNVYLDHLLYALGAALSTFHGFILTNAHNNPMK